MAIFCITYHADIVTVQQNLGETRVVARVVAMDRSAGACYQESLNN